MDSTQQAYEQKMEEIGKYYLQVVGLVILDFLSVFPHNTMEIKKLKANNAAYQASSIVWESYPAVREAVNAIENTLYLACNEVFIPSLCNEVAKLQLSTEALLEAYRGTKNNPHMQGYCKGFPTIFGRPKDLVALLVSDLKKMNFVVDLDEKFVYTLYKEEYQKEKKNAKV
jgi:hypothetical protein